MRKRQLALPLEPDQVRRADLTETDQALVAQAIHCLEQQYLVKQDCMTSPAATRDYLRLRLYGLPYEVFACLLLDTRHRVIRYEELFRGTIDGASVHPREVVRMVMESNAAAVILAHNHPSGPPEPSQSDLRITQRLKDALGLIDVRVLDHLIVGDGEAVSLAERGLVRARIPSTPPGTCVPEGGSRPLQLLGGCACDLRAMWYAITPGANGSASWDGWRRRWRRPWPDPVATSPARSTGGATDSGSSATSTRPGEVSATPAGPAATGLPC